MGFSWGARIRNSGSRLGLLCLSLLHYPSLYLDALPGRINEQQNRRTNGLLAGHYACRRTCNRERPRNASLNVDHHKTLSGTWTRGSRWLQRRITGRNVSTYDLMVLFFIRRTSHRPELGCSLIRSSPKNSVSLQLILPSVGRLDFYCDDSIRVIFCELNR